MGLALAAPKVITALRPQAEPRRRLERLLVVDDERMACNLISLRLRQNGFQVDTANTAAEALDTIHTSKVDLVLLDRIMPGWNGDRVLKELRQFHSPAALPVIMVSAIDDSDQIAEALEMGANDYITKPIDFTVALARIRSQLTRSHSGSHAEGFLRPPAGSFETRGDGLWDWNLETDQIYYCPRWVAMLGLAPRQVSGDPATWFSRVHPQDAGPLRSALQQHRDGKTPSFEMEYRIRCKDGAFRWMASRGVAFRDADGKAFRMAGSQTDITESKTMDSVTGLPNRTLFMERLTGAMEQSCLNPGRNLAVLIIDVGHSAGDGVLIEFARRIRAVLVKWRSVAEDREGSLVARMSADQLAALVEGITSPLQAVSLADQILQALTPMLPANIGIALPRTVSRPEFQTAEFQTAGFQTADDILENANTAMLSAKAREKDCWALFSDSMFSDSMRGQAADRIPEKELRDALPLGQLQVFYQPRVDLNTEEILGFEALARWNHPDRGLLLPAEFVPLAEQIGLIREIGQWVMEQACSQIKQWQGRPGQASLDIAVNVSPVQLREPDFVSRVLDILHRTGLSPSGLQLELTESVPVLDMEGARRKLCELKEIGVGLKMDDFATGYSSLQYLSKLPFDSLKIDHSFIADLDDQSGVPRELVRTILSMAANLKIGVIAEGIERPEQLKCLRELGCRFGQGFYFSEPLDAAGIERLLNQNTFTTSALSPAP